MSGSRSRGLGVLAGLLTLLALGIAAGGVNALGAAPAGLDLLAAKDCPLAKGERIAFLGDSITQGGAGPGGYCRLIDEAIAKAHPDLGVKIIYAGISGHRVPDLQKRLDRDVLSKKPEPNEWPGRLLTHDPRYRVTLAFGKALEPRVVKVEEGS